MEKESFGDLLSKFRRNAGFTQQDLASTQFKISASQIAMLETGERGKQKTFNREQVWYCVNKLKLWPPECDQLLEAAGLSTDRSEDEERDIQENISLREMWIFARVLLDPEKKWFNTVAKNILEREVIYRYFTSDDDIFLNLIQRLKSEPGISQEILINRLECYLLPQEIFITNFAIYNPGAPNMYCCGTKPEHGKAIKFYTMHQSEASRLYEFLKKWRNRINGDQDIRLQDALRTFPHDNRSRFMKETR